MLIIVTVFATPPGAGIIQAAAGSGIIAPPVPLFCQNSAYRRDSPSSLWEVVKKYHYAPCVSSRPACHGGVQEMRGSSSAAACSLGAWGTYLNTVYEIIKEQIADNFCRPIKTHQSLNVLLSNDSI